MERQLEPLRADPGRRIDDLIVLNLIRRPDQQAERDVPGCKSSAWFRRHQTWRDLTDGVLLDGCHFKCLLLRPYRSQGCHDRDGNEHVAHLRELSLRA